MLEESVRFVVDIDITKIRHIVFRTELYHHFTVSQLMSQPPATLVINDPMEDVMRKFDETNAQQLPVLDVEGHLTGYISRMHMYAQYRQMVADFSAE